MKIIQAAQLNIGDKFYIPNYSLGIGYLSQHLQLEVTKFSIRIALIKMHDGLPISAEVAVIDIKNQFGGVTSLLPNNSVIKVNA